MGSGSRKIGKMRSLAIVLLSAVALSRANPCQNDQDVYFPDREDCGRFYMCRNGEVVGHMNCPDGLLWNTDLLTCAGTEGNDARKEMTKTKEQLEEEKKIALSIRIKPLDLEAMDSDDLKAKATELFNIVIQLETDKYDYEQKRQQQERDLQELKERQKAQLRQKVLKKGLDPEALVGKYPPMIRMYSKYERRTDTRTYEDRKKLYEGGWEVTRAESLDAIWKEKYEEWSKRPSKKLPKWFGERPGKKAGDAPTPEGEEDGGEEAAAEEEYDEEEEEEEEYDEEE